MSLVVVSSPRSLSSSCSHCQLMLRQEERKKEETDLFLHSLIYFLLLGLTKIHSPTSSSSQSNFLAIVSCCIHAWRKRETISGVGIVFCVHNPGMSFSPVCINLKNTRMTTKLYHFLRTLVRLQGIKQKGSCLLVGMVSTAWSIIWIEWTFHPPSQILIWQTITNIFQTEGWIIRIYHLPDVSFF